MSKRERKRNRMKPYIVESNEIINNIPDGCIRNSLNIGSSVLDQTDSEKLELSCADQIRGLSVSNGEDSPEISQISLIRTPVVHFKKKLLVLDVNGLLVDIVCPPPKDKQADARIAGRAIFKRPSYLEFLKFCFEKFEVGIWSSRTRKNINKVIDYLMGDMKHKLLFCWNLSHCTGTSFKTLENRHKPLVFKDLKKIWEKHDPDLPWEKGYYNESNTLLLDDSPYKALLNPPYTSIFPHTYRFNSNMDNSLAAEGDLRKYLDGLAMAENMQEYVKQNPFGQKAVSERSPSWEFYSKVVDSLSSSQKEDNMFVNLKASVLSSG